MEKTTPEQSASVTTSLSSDRVPPAPLCTVYDIHAANLCAKFGSLTKIQPTIDQVYIASTTSGYSS